ncbi:hypothetical protein, unlikely [Trypanosoma brucei brucei TREU927]|uniref:Uncharacterized protein n=1 Tax=Trypanosoma brucei brucei (strain 927/4 GUTat10.1) TaxID=185431 RepID=Q4GZ38_TRYB2|nr:hypothetical protein, unlikely [Trypanosoma brucei brucei TREU927]CAJ16203.1 hypothetical protein, unlikely [Trypanosoma brucei brucei TREU927]
MFRCKNRVSKYTKGKEKNNRLLGRVVSIKIFFSFSNHKSRKLNKLICLLKISLPLCETLYISTRAGSSKRTVKRVGEYFDVCFSVEFNNLLFPVTHSLTHSLTHSHTHVNA